MVQTVRQRIRRVRRAARFAQLAAFVWALSEAGFVLLGFRDAATGMIVTHGLAFLVAAAMQWLMAAAARAFQEDLVAAAEVIRAEASRRR